MSGRKTALENRKVAKQRNQSTFKKLFQTEPHKRNFSYKEKCFFRLIEIQYLIAGAQLGYFEGRGGFFIKRAQV